MRSLILLCTIGFFSSTIAAQDFEVVSSFPEDGAFGVLTDSILITFSQPVDINVDGDDLEEDGFFGFIEPEESFQFDSLAKSEDGLTLKFFGTFDSDTDYLLYILDAVSTSGENLSSPFVLQFSTFATEGPYTLSGFVYPGDFDEYELEKFGYTVFLSKQQLEFIFYEPDEEEENEGDGAPAKINPYTWDSFLDHDGDDNGNEDENELTPIYATLIDTSDYSFTIRGIRDGSYFPYAFNLYDVLDLESNEDGNGEDIILDFFRYDADGDRGIDSVYFDVSIAEGDLPDNILLTYLNLHPYPISEAFSITEAYKIVNGLTTWQIFGGYAEYRSSYYDNDDSHNESFADGHVPLFFDVVDGTNHVWNIFGYDATKDSVAGFITTPTGAELLEILGEEDVEEEGIDFSEIKPLGSTLSSEDAIEAMFDAGLEAAYNNMAFEFGPDFEWDFEFQLLHEYWDFVPDPTPTAPVTWKGTLYGYTFDENDGAYYDAEYEIYIDAETGDLLYQYATPIPDVETISLINYSLPSGSADPAADTLIFVFDGRLNLDLNAADPDDTGLSLFIEPEDSTVILDVIYAGDFEGDSSRVTIIAELTDDTDYIVFIADVRGTNGEQLDQPYVLQFTTGDPSNRFTISGYLETPDIDINNYFRNMVVMLVDEEPEFGFDFFDEEDDGSGEGDNLQDNHEEDEDDFVPTYAANVDPESGYFEINLVREGDYYPIAFDVTEMDEEEEFEEDFFDPRIYYYDANGDRYPNILEVTDSQEFSDIMADFELRALRFDRFTLSEAIDLAARRIDYIDIGDVEFMGGATFFQFFGFEDISFKKGLNTMPRAIIMDHDDGPIGPPFMVEPDGRNFIWQVFVYHPTKDSALATMVTPIGAMFEGFIAEEDIEDPIEFDVLKALPENYIDSDSAAIRFEEEGGAAFIDFLETSFEPGSYYWFHDIQALHEYWDYPFGTGPDEPLAWKATYEYYAFDQMTGTEFTDSLIIYLDVETGDLLYVDLPVNNELNTDTPNKIELGQNYPNPFNPSTIIPFELSKSSNVQIEVFNLLGQKVATLTNDLYSAGRHSITWNASSYSSGIYFYRLTAGDVIQTKKLMLIK